jgi:hypothetical protein
MQVFLLSSVAISTLTESREPDRYVFIFLPFGLLIWLESSNSSNLPNKIQLEGRLCRPPSLVYSLFCKLQGLPLSRDYLLELQYIRQGVLWSLFKDRYGTEGSSSHAQGRPVISQLFFSLLLRTHTISLAFYLGIPGQSDDLD